MTKQPKMREYSAHTDFSFNRYVLLIFIPTLPPSLTSCILNVVEIFRDAFDVTYVDDVILISESEVGLQNCLNKLDRYCEL